MNVTIVLIAMILMWIVVVVGMYQRIFEMPKWFANPPASFELIRRQSKKSRAFWLPLSVIFMTSLIIALILNWKDPGVRNYLFATLACYGIVGALSGMYFVKEVIGFTKIPEDAPQTPELLKKTKFWLRWTSVRDVLQVLAAIFLTTAYIHL